MSILELDKYQEERTLVEVYTNAQDTTRFDVGYILAFDDDFFIMLTLSKYGRLDGFYLYKTENIIRICVNSKYLKKMTSLMRFYNEKQDIINIDKYLVYDLLDYCRINNRIVSVEILDSGNIDTRGYIEELDVDKCCIRQISEYGENNGVTSILLKDISEIKCCSSMEVMHEILSSELFDEIRSH